MIGMCNIITNLLASTNAVIERSTELATILRYVLLILFKSMDFTILGKKTKTPHLLILLIDT
jgi:hypothetical protein